MIDYKGLVVHLWGVDAPRMRCVPSAASMPIPA